MKVSFGRTAGLVVAMTASTSLAEPAKTAKTEPVKVVAQPTAKPFAKGPSLCPGTAPLPPLGSDGRLLGHFPYIDANPADLVPVPPGFGSGNCKLVHRDVFASLDALVRAARADPKVGNTIMGLSCHRTIARQKGLFCNPAKLKARGYAGQAKWIAPPGYSEHASGFALDFAARNAPGCQASTCFSGTAVSRWLRVNGSKYGFEPSFPANNKQGVSYEPWHWRWIGRPGDPGASRARSAFSRTRTLFPEPRPVN